MPIAIAAILIIVGVFGAAVLVLAVPALIALVGYDEVASRKSRTARPQAAGADAVRATLEAAERRIFLERGFARAFVIAGGAFWAIAAFAGLYWFRDSGVPAAFLAAGIPLVATLVTLIIGWYWERLAAVMLGLASVGVVYWGVVVQFELGVWILVTLALIGPMLTAAVLFWLARRELEALELSLAQPELAMATAERSSY